MVLIVRVLVIFSPERVVLMPMLDIESDTSIVVPFGNTLFQVNCGVGSPVAVQLRTAGAGERTSTSMGLASRVTGTRMTKYIQLAIFQHGRASCFPSLAYAITNCSYCHLGSARLHNMYLQLTVSTNCPISLIGLPNTVFDATHV